jgi:chemotaxis protein methyltransferase CheR
MPTEYADKYFLKSGTKYILNNEVKALVNFEYHNLAKDPYSLDTMRDLDIIFCRNVTIYFDLTTTKRVIDDFYDCASDNGYLFIGHSESLWQITNKFRPIEFPQTFIYKKTKFIKEEITIHPIVALPEIGLEEITARANIEAKTISDASEGLTKKTKPTAENKRLDHMTAAALRFSNKKKYREAMLIFDKIIELNNSYVPAHFGRSILLANQESYEGAANELRTTIKLDNLHIEAYYLLGVISYKTGALKEAEEQFKKVAYLDHSVALAYYNLGNIYLTQKEFHKAEREFNNTIKTIKNTPKNSKIKFGEDFTPEILIMACENNLKEIRILKH